MNNSYVLAVKHDRSVSKYLKPVLMGSLAGMALTLFILLAASLILSSRYISGGAAVIVSHGAVAAGSLAAGCIPAFALKEKGLVIGISCGVLLYFVFFLLGAAIVGGGIGGGALIKLGAIVVPAVFGGILGVNFKRKRKA
ncbi:MAG: TIGR04086 family membrane protein [Oscillospiraceae bacterium]|jgi:putative membrane protein (TIGR04086 family)|nr:TIGR04086 family membrane protein [Oscillospiraceae bacterium]